MYTDVCGLDAVTAAAAHFPSPPCPASCPGLGLWSQASRAKVKAAILILYLFVVYVLRVVPNIVSPLILPPPRTIAMDTIFFEEEIENVV